MAKPRQCCVAMCGSPAGIPGPVSGNLVPVSGHVGPSSLPRNLWSRGYDAALYSAATTYYQQQQAAKTGASTWQYKKAGTTTMMKTTKPKQPPKPPQLHYCEVCKISCAGPQTYREHLEGQKHKKKEAAAKQGAAQTTGRGQNQLRCELCDVSCTGADAYAAHIRGAKHQKVLKLHTKLGKPIPSSEPTVVSNTTLATTVVKTSTATVVAAKPGVVKTSVVPAAPVAKKVVAAPKINFVAKDFVGGTQLKTTGGKTEEVKTAKPLPTGVAVANSAAANAAKVAPAVTTPDDEEDTVLLPGEKDVQPVGQEYIEEVKNELGKTVSFNCKLCECKFNDPNAKEMHMKGRRHRLQYKKKVDPSLQVEVKPSIRARKLQEEKLRRQAAKEEYWRRRDMEDRWREEMRYMMEEEQYYMGRGYGGPGGRPFGPGGPMSGPPRRPDTSDDRHVMQKHASIYPNEQELQAVQNIVSSCEKALKLVSDFVADSDAPKPMDTEVKKEEKKKVEVVKKEKEKEVKKEPKKEGEEEKEEEEEEKKEDDAQTAPRALKGVMRVGVLAKGLLLHGDLNVHLVLLCSEKPTRTLLERVADCLPKQLGTAAPDEAYEVKMCVEEAAVIVTAEKEIKTTCTITLTSPIMREEAAAEGETVTVKDPPDVLDRQKCLDALAALRHAKWFQARANGLQSCVVVIRILRDLCQRVPTWTPLNQWAMELLVEKCVSSGGANMSPGDALRRVFECIASGILLPGGPGLYDPCEKEPSDAAASLTPQEREDITASAQHALRLIAFRQIHKVLGMDALPAPRYPRGQRFNPRKRRRTNSTGEGAEGEGGEKKDKKDDGDASSDTAAAETSQA